MCRLQRVRLEHNGVGIRNVEAAKNKPAGAEQGIPKHVFDGFDLLGVNSGRHWFEVVDRLDSRHSSLESVFVLFLE